MRSVSAGMLVFKFVIFFILSLRILNAAGFECAFALATLHDKFIDPKSDSRSLMGASYSGAIGSPERHSPFVERLNLIMSEMPALHVTKSRDIAVIRESFAKNCIEFQAWYARTREVFLTEMKKQNRSPAEVATINEAFANLNAIAESLKNPSYLNFLETLPERKRSRAAYEEIVQLRHAMAEVIFASTKADLVCTSCQAIDVVAKLLHTTKDDPNFQKMYFDVFPEPVRFYMGKTELDAVTMSPDGKLNVYEFKYNNPHVPDHRKEYGPLSVERAARTSRQLYRISNVISGLYKVKDKVQAYGYTLDISDKPTLHLSSIVPYQNFHDVKELIGHNAPDNLNYAYSPFLKNPEVEEIFSQLLDDPYPEDLPETLIERSP